MSGKDIRAKRVSAGLTAVLVCTKARINRSRFSDIERGHIAARDEELRRIDSAIAEIISTRRKLTELAQEAGLSLAGVHL